MTGPRSLADMCLKVAVDNANAISDLSNVLPEYVSTILKAVKSATQLRQLEVNTGDIYDLTAEHWKRLIQAEFPSLSARHKLAPKDPKSWHKVYGKYRELYQEEVYKATERMQESFAAHKEQQDSRRSTIISAAQGRKMQRTRARSGWGVQREKQTSFDKVKKQLAMQSAYFNLQTKAGKMAASTGQVNKRPGSDTGEGTCDTKRQKITPSVSQPAAKRPATQTSHPPAAPGANNLSHARPSTSLVSCRESTPLHDDDLFGAVDGDDLFGDSLIPQDVKNKRPSRRVLLPASPGANEVVHSRASPASPRPSAPSESRPSAPSVSHASARSGSPPWPTVYHLSSPSVPHPPAPSASSGPPTPSASSRSSKSIRAPKKPVAPQRPPQTTVNSLSTGGSYRPVSVTIERPKPTDSPDQTAMVPLHGVRSNAERRNVHRVHFFTAANRRRRPN